MTKRKTKLPGVSAWAWKFVPPDPGLGRRAKPTRNELIDGRGLDTAGEPVRVRIIETREVRKIVDELDQLREIAEAAAAAMAHTKYVTVRYDREQLLLDLLKEWEETSCQ
jgi:hypothetical protein